ncbi:MAG: hypothetical protein JXR97_08700 [Planctomycetes bacterium]|nr:hypothetical protein [Planctomycetota bacterium]
MIRFACLFTICFCLASALAFGGEWQRPALEVGQWIEWEITLPAGAGADIVLPVMKKDVGMVEPEATEVEDEKKAEQEDMPEFAATESLRFRVSIAEIQENKSLANVMVTSGDKIIESKGIAFDTLAALVSGDSTETAAVKTKSVFVDGRDMTVRETTWIKQDLGQDMPVVRWEAPELPFGPVYLKAGAFEMKLVGFGKGEEPFPLKGAPVLEKDGINQNKEAASKES